MDSRQVRYGQIKAEKWSQTILTVVSIVFAMATTIPLGNVTSYFGGKCVLYADMAVRVRLADNVTKAVDVVISAYGGQSVCHFTTYFPALTLSHAILWLWFRVFWYNQIEGAGKAASWLVAQCVLCGMFSLCLLVSSAMVTLGKSHWCQQFETSLENGVPLSCQRLQQYTWTLYSTPNAIHHFYINLMVAEISGWLLTSTLTAQWILALIRSYYEFFVGVQPAVLASLTTTGSISKKGSKLFQEATQSSLTVRNNEALPELPPFESVKVSADINNLSSGANSEKYGESCSSFLTENKSLKCNISSDKLTKSTSDVDLYDSVLSSGDVATVNDERQPLLSMKLKQSRSQSLVI